MKVKKINIGSPENPKFTNIGDYWDEETVTKITDLMHGYQDLFPTNFSEMKGIVCNLGEMKIPLQPNAKPSKQRMYRLNPRYKEKVKEELDHMLDAGIIEPLEESEWIIPIVIQDKKNTGEVRICIDLRKLNDAFLHNPFSTSFIDEVLESIIGKEMYSLTDEFSGYH